MDLEDRIEKDDVYQATYNYSETIVMGLTAHNLRDVHTHRKTARFYINPPLLDSPLAARKFPADGPSGDALAGQIDY